MKKLNPFERKILNGFYIVLFIVIQCSVYGTLSWNGYFMTNFFGENVQTHPFWAVYMLSGLAGVVIDFVLICICLVIYSTTIEPLMKAYRESYPKKPKIKNKNKSKIELYKESLL